MILFKQKEKPVKYKITQSAALAKATVLLSNITITTTASCVFDT